MRRSIFFYFSWHWCLMAGYFFAVAFFLSFIIASLFSIAHSINAFMCGSSEYVRGVSAYSTLGGTSGYTVRVT